MADPDAALKACVDACVPTGDLACTKVCLLDEGWLEPAAAPSMVISLTLALVLVCLSGLFSGLTLGLMSLDTLGLQIVAEGGEDEEAKHAKKIMPVRKHGNLLLCTLLLGNTIVNALIAILLADITSGALGLVASTFLIVTFGEIIPQALCSRHGLMVGARTIWLVKIFMIVLFVVAWPISIALDKILGRDLGTVYSQDELKRLIAIHVENPDAQQESGLTADDHNLLFGALEYKDKLVKDVHTDLDNVFMVEEDTKLDFEMLFEVYKSGFTRIPVYKSNRDNVIGILFSKDLILIDPDDEIRVGALLSFHGRYIQWVNDQTSLDKVFGIFKRNSLHLLVSYSTDDGHVTDSIDTTMYEGNNGGGEGDRGGRGGEQSQEAMEAAKRRDGRRVTGVITLEDVLEEVIKAEIVDETDNYEDTNNPVHRVRRRDNMKYLSLFEHKMKWKTKLSMQEVQAVAAYLTINVREFKDIGESQSTLKALIAMSELIEVNDNYDGDSYEKAAPGYATGEEGEDRGLSLYTAGHRSDMFTLIIQGKVVVVAGSEGFESELGPWNFLACNALSTPDYMPDYSATAVGVCRLLRIKREEYEACMAAKDTDVPWLTFKSKAHKRMNDPSENNGAGRRSTDYRNLDDRDNSRSLVRATSMDQVRLEMEVDREEGYND